MNKTKNVSVVKVSNGVSYEWGSYEEFLADLQEIREARPEFYSQVRGSGQFADHDKRSESWWGCIGGFDAVVKHTKSGWPALREKVAAMMRGMDLELPNFPSRIVQRRRKRRRDDHGDALDINRVWNGELDKAWEHPARVERIALNTKRMTLAFDVTSNARVTNEMALWRAALCIALCDALARAGRVFEIWVIDSASDPFVRDVPCPPRLWSGWRVKRANDPLVLDRLCAMVSVGFVRSAGFIAMGCGPWSPRASFGCALNAGLPDTLRQRQEEGELVLRIGECYTKAQVISEYAHAMSELESASQK